MAKPRVFVSSTYYDLKHVRHSISAFIESIGYESVLFENGDITFNPSMPLDDSCYGEINSCHVLVLIIGGRYGSPTSSEQTDQQNREIDDGCKFYNSITRKEYETAKSKNLPIYIFVEKNVMAEFQTYKENKGATIKFAHVDNQNIYLLIEDILSQKHNNLVKDFENSTQIVDWLRSQWAGLFADFISKRSQDTTLSSLSSQISELNIIGNSLKKYTEKLLEQAGSDGAKDLIIQENQKINRSRLLSKFKSENLINYIANVIIAQRNTVNDDRYITIVYRNLYNKFMVNTSFESFINSTDLPDSEKKQLVLVDAAKRDYRVLVDRYKSVQKKDFDETEQ
jgi:hypothetical protein